jgi:hypothetical protein
MADTWTLHEPCAGSAALSYYLLGAKRSLLSYQGSKWRFRFALEDAVRELGFEGAPARVVLEDVGPWQWTHAALGDRYIRSVTLNLLEQWLIEDPKTVYDRLHGASVQGWTLDMRAAAHLFLQRLAYAGKAVGCKGGVWKSPGFNPACAYGIPGTDKFGEVKPMIPSLISSLRRLPDLSALWALPIRGSKLVYIDPPYAGTTAYPDGTLTREEVISMALNAHAEGSRVIVSEAEAIPELVAQGWQSRMLYAGRDDTSSFRGKQEEWITFF